MDTDAVYITGKSLTEAIAEATSRKLQVKTIALHPADHDALLAMLVKAVLEDDIAPMGRLRLLKSNDVPIGECKLECYPIVEVADVIAAFEDFKTRIVTN